MEAYHEMLVKFREELTRPLQEVMEFMRRVESQLNSLSISGWSLRSILSSEHWQEEWRDRQRQPAGKVGDKEHELPRGEIVEGSGAGVDPFGKRRRPPSEQVVHQVECPLRLETLGMD
jgi:hypothetical protein